MDEKEINGRLEQIIRKITDKELTITEMEKDSLLSSNVGLSPLDLLNLFFAIEREFNIYIDRKEIIEHRLDKISDILNSESDEYDEVERDRLFHYSLIYATNNKLWICFMEAIMDIYREWIDAVLSNADSDTKKLLKEVHNSIFSSIKERDMAKCEASIDKHYDIIERELFMR